MTARDSGNIAILSGHPVTGGLQLVLLFCPYVSHRDVEAEDASMHGIDQFLQPCLQGDTLLTLLAAHPKRELGDDDGARVTVILVFLEPGDNAGVAFSLGGLAQDIRIEEPAHSLRRFGNSRRLGGRSSISSSSILRIEPRKSPMVSKCVAVQNGQLPVRVTSFGPVADIPSLAETTGNESVSSRLNHRWGVASPVPYFACLGLAFPPDVLRATAARMSALNALASTASPSWMSIARLVFPSRLELKSLAGSFNEAPLAKVNFTIDL